MTQEPDPTPSHGENTSSTPAAPTAPPERESAKEAAKESAKDGEGLPLGDTPADEFASDDGSILP